MEIYTKKGDAGLTSLQKQKNIAKSDDRIQLVGNLEELISHIGTIKCRFQDPDRRKVLEEIRSRTCERSLLRQENLTNSHIA